MPFLSIAFLQKGIRHIGRQRRQVRQAVTTPPHIRHRGIRQTSSYTTQALVCVRSHPSAPAFAVACVRQHCPRSPSCVQVARCVTRARERDASSHCSVPLRTNDLSADSFRIANRERVTVQLHPATRRKI